jgi:hypothetical protein
MENIKNGTLIVSEGIDLPESFNVKTRPFAEGWRAVTNLWSGGLDKRFSDIGWTVFHKGAPQSVSAVGVGRSQTVLKAFGKIARRGVPSKFNCLEITHSVQKTFMGLTYVHMSARARNIRQRP